MEVEGSGIAYLSPRDARRFAGASESLGLLDEEIEIILKEYDAAAGA